jgi:hypothetical protein
VHWLSTLEEIILLNVPNGCYYMLTGSAICTFFSHFCMNNYIALFTPIMYAEYILKGGMNPVFVRWEWIVISFTRYCFV